MKFKIPIIFVLILLINSCFAFNIYATTLTLYDSELWDNPEFSQVRYGPANFTRSNPAGEGVIFSFTGLASSATGINDNYPVSDVGQILPSHANGDFRNFDTYQMLITNLDDQIVSFSLILNTGFTGTSGIPSNDPTNDTFWQSSWVDISAGQTELIIFNFSNAIPWGVEDNKFPHTQGGTDGVAMAINDWDHSEVSSLGFQVADFTGTNPNVSLHITAVPEPISCLFFLIGASILIFKKSK